MSFIKKDIGNCNIVIIFGGDNSESEVSKVSGSEVYKSLINLGYNATSLEFNKDTIVQDLIKIKPDIVFNAMHGEYGEDGRLQGLLDIMQIPYTHSGLLSSALCMNKAIFRDICLANDIPIASGSILKKYCHKNQEKIDKIAKPFVIKPLSLGSSIGVEIILEDTEFDIDQYQWRYGDEVIIEKYIKGKEINVAIFDNKSLGAIQVVPKNALFYDYESKYKSGMTEYIKPNLSKDQYDEIMQLALRCHNITGCKDISRVEFLIDDYDGKIYVLELNTHPGLTPLSLVPRIAQDCGISFEDIILYLIKNASYSR